MKHQLPPLPFAMDALAPQISAETIEYHYGKHHRAYVDKLNKLIIGTPFESASLEQIVLKATGDIFNNGAQVWNHTFYWQCLTPKPKQPGSQLLNALNQRFGSFDAFRSKFDEAASGLFGSGWAWLVKTKAGGIEIRCTPDAENPVRNGEIPLLTCDVWEHAYYLDYKNERGRYLAGIWNIVNWEFVESNFRAVAQLAA